MQRLDILPWKCGLHSKGKIHTNTSHEATEGDYSSTLSLTSTLYGDGRSMPRPNRVTPGNIPVPIVRV